MGEDHDVVSFESGDLGIDPIKVPPVRFIMCTCAPVHGLVKVVKAGADGHLALRRDGGEETTAENGDVCARQKESSAVEEDKFSQGWFAADILLELTQDVERFGPARVVGFVVPRHEEHSAELPQLADKEGKVVIFVGYCVADVTKKGKVGRSWCDLEDVVGFWYL